MTEERKLSLALLATRILESPKFQVWQKENNLPLEAVQNEAVESAFLLLEKVDAVAAKYGAE